MSDLHTPCRFIVKHWQLLAMQDGYTLHTTVIEAVPVKGGFLPSFVGKRDTRVVVDMATPLPTAKAARNSLRDVLWGAHVEQRINLDAHPLTATEEHAA
ncbi:hypothetical protein [Halomonas sp. MS1]|nr:hypothetical protein [Halomonas sp. MS1]UTD54956.1 hypothetical protein NF683_17685 [Halomonas sp. MS1]